MYHLSHVLSALWRIPSELIVITFFLDLVLGKTACRYCWRAAVSRGWPFNQTKSVLAVFH